MKNKLTLLFVGLTVAVSSVASAATISVSRGTGNPGIIAATSGGSPLSAGGYYISVGTFTQGGVTVEPVITNAASVLAAVNSFDLFATALSPISGGTQGTITGAFTSLGAPTPSEFNNKAIYFIVGNGATKETSTQFGIFKVTAGATFPVDVTDAGSTPVQLASGSVITAIAGTVSGNNLLLFNTIPEPSTALLGAVGALALLRRRRN